MNNFDKWKSELTVKDFAKSMAEGCYVCDLCPCKKDCPLAIHSGRCEYVIEEWAEEDTTWTRSPQQGG